MNIYDYLKLVDIADKDYNRRVTDLAEGLFADDVTLDEFKVLLSTYMNEHCKVIRKLMSEIDED